MTALTRIKNNQIYDSTIYANAKIVPGSIVGTLFNSNITVTSDFLITGNLTVLGNSTVTTVASTNTFVNDPLIVMNNAFAGTNTYDLGFVFERGDQTNTGLTWDESGDEFVFAYTSETGTTYGAINLTSYANVHVGNLITEYDLSGRNAILSSTDDSTSASTGALQIAGGVGIAKDLFLGGGDVTTDQTTFNLLNATATTVNAFGDATSVVAGATSGTFNLRNANIYLPNATTIFTGQTGVAFANTVATTLSIGGDATAVLLGATTGVTSIRNASFDVYGNANVKMTTGSTSQYTGALVTYGGLGVVENFNLGGYANIRATTNAVSNDTGALVVAGGASFAKDVWIGGNLHVSNVIAQNDITLTVQDPLLYLTANTTYPYNYDIGFFSQFVGGTANVYQHTGFVRDASDDVWKLFSNVASEPTATVDFTDAGLKWESLKLGNIQLTGPTRSTSYATGALQVDGGVGVLGNVSIGGDTHGLCISGDLKGNVVFPTAVVDVTASSNNFVRYSLQNLSSDIHASSEYVAVAEVGDLTDTGTLVGGNVFAAFGIANGGFDRNNIIKPYDGFVYVVAGEGQDPGTGNLVLFSSHDVVIANGNGEANIAIRVKHDDKSVYIPYLGTDTNLGLGDEANVAALVVEGSITTNAGLFSAMGGVFNRLRYNLSQGNPDGFGNVALGVRGVNCEHMFFLDAGYQTLVLNGPSAGEFQPNVTPGSTFTVNSDDSIVIPVGTTAQRPSNSGNVDVAGMLRLNSSTTNMEYYDGSQWQVAGSVFTVISDRQFSANTGNPYGNVDGVNDTFTLQSEATASSVLVTINGVVQIPVVAYGVSGTTLTFTEAPSEGDYIDVRVLTTTATIEQLASANGYNQIIANTDGVSMWTGTTATTQRILLDPVGNFTLVDNTKIVYEGATTSIPSTSAVLLDTWSVSTYGTAKYVVQTRNGSDKIESMEAIVVAEGSNASIVTYGIVNSHGSAMGTLSANVVGGNCRLYYTSDSLSNSNVKVYTTYIEV